MLNPTLPAGLHLPLAPALALERLVTVGTTPAVLRERIGLSWDARRQLMLGTFTTAVRAVNAVQPAALRTAPAWLGNRLLAALS